jgi:hypothetical protein
LTAADAPMVVNATAAKTTTDDPANVEIRP